MLYPTPYRRPDASQVQPILGTLRTKPLPESGFGRDDYPVAHDATKSGRL